ncbi:hypothetical protein EG329_004726 [Mollisiaceae sp. DMI_Dod_QoI]|nr:hypothetical protein EG329_004726 [Helotiales sp. DMI_Dod_QoI]
MNKMGFQILLLFVGLGVCTNYIGLEDVATGTDVFVGIPYAQPPVGALRLQPPLPISDDLGDLNVSSLTSNRCYELNQSLASISAGSEDCLTLDIVRPSRGSVVNARRDNKLPVYVFIHGGNFNDGDKSDYDGRDLVKTSVQLSAPFIYVSINYRLSFLGFPSGNQFTYHHNLGLLDQYLALQWVQEEIQWFGGNPTKIVIGGHSAGANSVAYQMMAYGAKTKGLFHGAILQSGSATALSAIQHAQNSTWQKSSSDIATAVGCNVPSDILPCLQSVPIDSLITAYTTVFTNSGFHSPISMYSPVPDANFMESWPSDLMNDGVFAKVPTIVGTTTNELVERISISNSIGSDAAVLQATEPNFPLVPNNTLQELLSYYPVTSYPNIGPPLSGAQWSRAVAIENDVEMFCPANTQAVQVSAVAPVWKFRWNSVLQSLSLPQWVGVPHSSELYYLFPYKAEDMTGHSSADLGLMLNFQRHIIGFITNLDPNSLPALQTTPSVHWSRFNNNTQSRLVYQRPDASGKGLHAEQDNVNQASCDFINSNNIQFS